MGKMNINSQVAELFTAANNMSTVMSQCDSWRDEVRNSYDSYVESTFYRLRSVEYTCSDISARVDKALSVDSEKFKAQLSEYKSKLGRI
jgi:hypothetical protein